MMQMAKYVDLIQLLNTAGDAVVEFTKLDGSTRLMRCIWGEEGKVEDTYSVVFDVEAEGYRRIRHDSIVRVG
jgi:hypothetical protein